MGLELRIIKDPCRDVPKPRTRSFGEQGGDIGRAPDSYWVLPDPKGYISSQHCNVEFRDGAYWLRDTSRNGVYLNGSREPVGRGQLVPLRHGDRVRLAEYELLVRLQSQPGPNDLSGRRRHEFADVPPSFDQDVSATGIFRKSLNGLAADIEHLGHADKRADNANDRDVHIDEDAAERVSDYGDERGDRYAHERVDGHADDPADDRVDDHDKQAGVGVPVTDVAATVVLVEDVPARDAGMPLARRYDPAANVERKPASASEHQKNGLLTRTRSLVASAFDRLYNGAEPAARAGSTAKAAWNPTDTGGYAAGMFAGPSGKAAVKSATFDKVAMEQHCVLLGAPNAGAFNAYKILRTRIRRRMTANQWRSLGVSGAVEGVGKTLTAINLGIAFAHDPRSPVFLVDLDLYRPRLASYLGMTFDKGLTDYLLGEAEISEILYSTELSGLVIVPNGRPLQNASELLASQRMSELVLTMESMHPHRTIIYDLPPLLMSDDVMVFSPHMDCLLDVIAVGVTPRQALERSKEILAELNVVGSVVNRASDDDGPSYYYYK
jgi:type VI secretion system FHA domain protein